MLPFIPSRLADGYRFSYPLHSTSLEKQQHRVRTKPSISAISSSGRKTPTHHQLIWWISSTVLPFQVLVQLPVKGFRTSAARVISWYSRWWRLSCGFLRRLECLSRRCPLLWHPKHKPNFSYNYHRSLTVDSSRFHTMSVHVFLSSQNITWVFACSFSWATSICLNLTWVSLVQDPLYYWSNQRLSLRLDSRFQPLI